MRGRCSLKLIKHQFEQHVRRNKEILTPGSCSGKNRKLSIAEALQLAGESALDLVEVSTNAKRPVCRVMDYGKYIFEQNEKNHAAKEETETDSDQGSEVPPRDGGGVTCR